MGRRCSVFWVAVVLVVGTLSTLHPFLSEASTGILSGGTTVNIAVRPVPCTLDPPMLDTPCEWSLLAWDIDVNINLRCSFDNMAVLLNTVFGIAGIEYVAPGAEIKLGDHTLKGTLLFATPFQAVTDIYNQPNTVVIPYGDLLFAGASLEVSLRFGTSSVRWLVAFQDLNFPNPGSIYNPPGWPPGEPLLYGAEHQEFAMGSLITISTRISESLPLSLQMGLGARPGSLSVKGYSLSGKVDPDSLFLSVHISGLGVPCPWCPGPIGEPRIGIAVRFEPWSERFWTLTGSVTVLLFDLAMAGTSFSLSTGGVSWGGISINIPHTLGTLTLQLDPSGELMAMTLSWAYRHQFVVGRTRGTCGFGGSWVDGRGVIGMNYHLTLNQALFSSSYGLSYAWRSDKNALGFTALRLRFTLNISPVQFSVPLVFGRGGLSSFGISAGYVF